MLLGLMLWFIWANHEQVTVAFPFGLGNLTQHDGCRDPHERPGRFDSDHPGHDPDLRHQADAEPRKPRKIRPTTTEAAADRPPPDYAAKTTDGFPNAHWSN